MKWRAVTWRWIVRPLGLGVVTTIAVAWGLAAWLPQRGWTCNETEHWAQRCRVIVNVSVTTGGERRGWKRSLISDCYPRIGLPQGIDRPTRQATRTDVTPRVSEWGLLPRVLEFEGDEIGCEHGTGWPLVAGWYSMRFDDSDRLTIVRGVPIELSHEFPDVSGVRALPLRPVWIGLVIDAIFYGVLWCALLAGVAAARSAWRDRRRGCCVKCGYDRRGLDAAAVCPECGTAAEGRLIAEAGESGGPAGGR